jgi:hypothetical protein
MQVDLEEKDIAFLLALMANHPITGKRDDVVRIVSVMDELARKLDAARQS